MSIPNTLTIFINTRIPGYQKLKFKPSMAIPTNMSETVYFDPLVKISRGSVSNVPEDANPGKYDDLAKSQFFDKGMFQTLVNRNLSSIFNSNKIGRSTDPDSAKIEKAKEAGIIDNNINVILSTLFRPNSVIYIGKKPYTIYSYHWDKGDWKINTKMLSPFTQPTSIYNRGQTINVFAGPASNYSTGRYQLAQSELKQLSTKATEGDNFDPDKYKRAPAGLLETGSASPALLPPAPPAVPSAPLLLEAPPAVAVAKPLLLGAPPAAAKPLLLGAPPAAAAKPLLLDAPAAAKPLLIGAPPSSSSSSVTLEPKSIEPGSASSSTALATVPTAATIPTATLVKEDSAKVGGGESDTEAEVKQGSTGEQSKSIRKYFRQYRGLSKAVYKYLPTLEIKKIINPELVEENGKPLINYELPDRIFNTNIEELRVFPTIPNGNCFFEAVATALNDYHNYVPGSPQYLNQEDIRKGVQNYFIQNKDKLKSLLEFANGVKNNMNSELEKYRKEIPILDSSVEKNRLYPIEINKIFNNRNVLFIQKPTSTTTGFTIPPDEDEALKFISSPNFWADDSIYPIIQEIYALKIITVLREAPVGVGKDKISNYSLPFPNLLRNEPGDTSDINNNSFDKYVFLLFSSSNHYDLITFYNRTQQGELLRMSALPRIPENQLPEYPEIEPPLYILLFIYGHFYQFLSDEDKSRVVLFENEMKNIETAYKEFKTTPISNEKEETNKTMVIQKFNELFYQGVPKGDTTKTISSPIKESELEPGTATGVVEPGETEPGATGTGVATGTTPGAPGATPTPSPTTKPTGLASGTKTNSMTTAFFGDSNLGFYIVVDLELYPGTSIPINKKFSIACDIQKEKIKESLAELRGKVYAPTPLNELYSNSPLMSQFKPVDTSSKKSTRGGKKRVNKTQKNKNHKKRKIRKTRKFGRRKYKTIKHRK